MSLFQGATMRKGGREMQSASPVQLQGPFVWQWRLMHMRTWPMYFRFTGEGKKPWQWMGVGWRENSSLLAFSSCPSPEDSAESSASDSKQSLHANTCSRPKTSHQLDSGESLWHSHSVTASADTSWDIGPVRREYKQEDPGNSFKSTCNPFTHH